MGRGSGTLPQKALSLSFFSFFVEGTMERARSRKSPRNGFREVLLSTSRLLGDGRTGSRSEQSSEGEGSRRYWSLQDAFPDGEDLFSEESVSTSPGWSLPLSSPLHFSGVEGMMLDRPVGARRSWRRGGSPPGRVGRMGWIGVGDGGLFREVSLQLTTKRERMPFWGVPLGE